jgi:hypothetical protein
MKTVDQRIFKLSGDKEKPTDDRTRRRPDGQADSSLPLLQLRYNFIILISILMTCNK